MYFLLIKYNFFFCKKIMAKIYGIEIRVYETKYNNNKYFF